MEGLSFFIGFVANCVLQRQKTGGKSINFRRWADGDEKGPYCVIMRVPKSVLWEEATDALATYLVAKVWLSVLTRIDQPISSRKPAFLIMDEPHQYLGSARGGIRSTWGNMITESRKWRLGLIFMVHDWKQLPHDLGRLIKSAGVHYVLYSSSKETFHALQEEILPFDLSEAMEIPTHQALIIARCEERQQRFLSKMAFPPINLKNKTAWRYPYINRKRRTELCSVVFGRPVDEVERDIYAREKSLYKGGKNEKKV